MNDCLLKSSKDTLQASLRRFLLDLSHKLQPRYICKARRPQEYLICTQFRSPQITCFMMDYGVTMSECNTSGPKRHQRHMETSARLAFYTFQTLQQQPRNKQGFHHEVV